jgi:hypothetical protein
VNLILWGYNVPLGFSLTDNPLVHVHDVYSIGSQSIVTFNCPGKYKVVRAALSGPCGLSVNAVWEGYFNSAGGGAGIVTLLEGVAQLAQGRTASQPWFGRKSWQSTSPLKFDIPIRFLSRFNAHDEVYLPMVGLLSFLYPRLDATSGETDKTNLFSKYFVPGPNLFYAADAKEDSSLFGLGSGGDPVEISIGSFLHFQGCYINSINFTIENSFNLEGYPHNVEARVSFEAMDVSFVNFDGSFMETKLGNQAFVLNKELEELVEKGEIAFATGKEAVLKFSTDAISKISGILK